MAFTAADVKKLREMTNVGMMDCKKALAETDGDMDKAVEWLREKGLAKAAKKANRIAAEGMAYATVCEKCGVGAVVEVNCETDFCAKSAPFVEFVKDICKVVLQDNPADVAALMECKYPGTANSVIDISKFSDANASDTEKNLYAKFQQKQQEVFDTITNRLTAENPPAVKDEDDQIQEYLTYICDDLLRDTLGVISKNAIDTSDSTYQKWTTDKDISLKDYLTYAASQNWIDISKFSTEGDYLDSDEVYQALTDYLIDYLKKDTNFSKLLYKYMLQEDTISGSEICLVLYEQGVLSKDDGSYEALASGSMTAYDFMINKIYTLEIEPAQLALEPCSASAVITDVKTGDVLACVSSPSGRT